MTDDELDAFFRRANEQMLVELDKRIDTTARLRELLREAGVADDLYADDSSSAGEVTDHERNTE